MNMFEDTPLSVKTWEMLDGLHADIIQAQKVCPSAVNAAIKNARDSLTKSIERATSPEGWSRETINQAFGPNIEFTGKLVIEHRYTRKVDDKEFIAELWETKGGNWVAIWGMEHELKAARFHHGDVIGVMDFWGWGSVARQMAKKLKWNLTVLVD